MRAFRFARLLCKALYLSSVQYGFLYRTFEQQLQNALLTSPAEVRRWDIINWFKLLFKLWPLSWAIKEMVEYCPEETRLRIVFHDAETKDNQVDADHDHIDLACPPCHPHAAFTAEPELEHRSGYEQEIARHGFRGDEDPPKSPADIKLLRARSEVPEIRLEQADIHDRFSLNGATLEYWQRSLVGQMEAWCKGVLEAHSPENIFAKMHIGITPAIDVTALVGRTKRVQNITSAPTTLFDRLM